MRTNHASPAASPPHTSAPAEVPAVATPRAPLVADVPTSESPTDSAAARPGTPRGLLAASSASTLAPAAATSRARGVNLTAWLFLAPALILLAVFSFWPVAFGSLLAFTDYSLIRETHWVGLDNFRYIFDNEMFVTGLKNSLLFLLMVPFVQIGALSLAVLVNNQLPGIRYFRAAFYVPVVTTVSVVGIMWGFMFHEQGALNYVLMTMRLVGAPVGWLSNDNLALFAIMFVTLWRGLGWYMVMYLAALQAVPADMQEAAILDGANRWQRFWKITVPMLRPTIMICSVLSVLAALKAYQEVDVLTQGGPMNSTFTGLYYAYDQGLKHLKLPRALAASFVMSIFCIAIALLCLRYIKPRHSQ